MKIDLLYDIIGSYSYTIDLEDYIDKDEWEEMTDEEQSAFVFDLGERLRQEAERDCYDYSLGEMEDWEEV